MRSLNDDRLHFVLFHEIRRRLAARMENGELTEERAMDLLLDTLNQIPGLKATAAGRCTVHLRSESDPERLHPLDLQNVVDGIRLLWNEFRER